MPDKTKATLVKELAAANRRATKAEKAVAKAEEEAEEGVAAATAKIAELESIIGGGSHNSDGHVCPRTSKALNFDDDVYATEKRLRSERDDWRWFSGGRHGMRGSNELIPKASAPNASVPQASAPSTPVKSETLLRQERNAARKASGGNPGDRGPNGSNPGQGLSTSARLIAETAAWLKSVGAKIQSVEAAQPATAAPQQASQTLSVKPGQKITFSIEVV